MGASYPTFANTPEDESKGCENSLQPEPAQTIEYHLSDMDQFRVRIMPVGMVIHRQQTDQGVFEVRAADGELQVWSMDGHLAVTIPFLTWEGLTPTWTLNERGESVLVAINRDHELHVLYPFSPDRPAQKVRLQGVQLSNAQLARGEDGSLVAFVPRGDLAADVILFKDGVLNRLAFEPAIAPLLIHPDERITAFGFEQVGEAEGRLIVFTNWRTLRYSRRSLQGQ